MNNPKPFQLTFKSKDFKRGDRISNGSTFFYMAIKLWSWLGFRYQYELEVLNEPVPIEDGYTYDVEYKKRMLYWKKYKIKDCKNLTQKRHCV